MNREHWGACPRLFDNAKLSHLRVLYVLVASIWLPLAKDCQVLAEQSFLLRVTARGMTLAVRFWANGDYFPANRAWSSSYLPRSVCKA